MNSNYSCNEFILNDSIINIFLTNIHETYLIGVIYPPINNKNNLCTNYQPMEQSESAIGDLNGDKIFDIVYITTFITNLTLYNFIAHSILTRFSLNINNIEYEIVANYQRDIFNKKIDEKLLNLLKEKNIISI